MRRAMRHAHERARGVDDLQTERVRAGQGPLRRAVRRHHDGQGLGASRIVRRRNSPGAEAGEDGVVVDEIAEDRQWRRVAVVNRELDGIANAETHPKVRRTEDSHTRARRQGAARVVSVR